MKDYLQYILDEIKGKRISKSEGIDLMRKYKSDDKSATQPVVAMDESTKGNIASDQLTITGCWHIIEPSDDTSRLSISDNVLVVCPPDKQYSNLLNKFKKLQYLFINPGDTISSIQQKLEQLSPIEHIIWIGSNNPLSKATDELIITGQEEGVIAIFKLIKALLEMSYGGKALNWTVITTNALAVNITDTVNPTHASVHGFAGVMSKEYPNWQVQLLDLEKESDLAHIDIFSLPLDGAGHVLANRHQRWYKQEYYPCMYQKNNDNNLYEHQGVYLVIGGAGGIGEVWTKHMIEKYTAQIIWLGRRDINQEIEAQIDGLEKLGPKPIYYKADATDLTQLQFVVNDVKRQFKSINGVVHSALVVSDRSLADLKEDDLRKGLAAKIDISVRLAQVFVDEPLDFMLFFSSMASLTCERGHSVYSAACVFKDTFAQYFANYCKYPIKIINWGYWSSVGAGMLVPDSFKKRLNLSGVGSIEPLEAMVALDTFLASNLQQVAFTKSMNPKNIEGYQDKYTLQEYSEQIPSIVSEIPKSFPMKESLMRQIDSEVEDPMNQMLPLLCKLLFGQLHKIGFFQSRYVDVEKEKQQVGLVKMYDRWLSESLKILTNAHLLTPDKNGYRIENRMSIDINSIWREWEDKKTDWLANNQIKDKVAILEISLKALPDVLLGKKLATEVIFPNSSMKLVEGIYKFNVVADYFNEILANVVLEYVKKRVEDDNFQGVRILEIGAGTGGTSDMVFKKLRPYQKYVKEYCYTDLSKAFLIHAEKEFGADNPYLMYKIFDVSKPIESQLFEHDYFDLVIATNVLHATKNIRQTLKNTKATMKKNGLLLLNELSSNNMVNHLAFSLLEGWWLSEDEELRIPGCPGLYPEMWEEALKNEGFSSNFFPAEDAHRFGQQIIVSESNGCVLRKVESELEKPLKNISNVHYKTEASETSPKAQKHELLGQIRHSIILTLSKSLKVEVNQIGVEEPFADYGLDSITGVHMMELLNEKLKLTLPTTDLFDYTSVNKLATYIVEQHASKLEDLFAENEHSLQEESISISSPESSVSNLLLTQGINTENSAIDNFKVGKESIAIIGMSGRFPQSENVEALWDHLKQSHDLIEEITRWNVAEDFREKKYCTRGGFLKDIDRFDPYFFNISELEARYMDPQQRIILEECWKSLEDAGYAGIDIDGHACGVYIGCHSGDYQDLIDDVLDAPAQSMWGNASSMLPARISYYLNLKGPAIAVDTACSSSLTAIHLACQGLWNGETKMALAGGVFVQSTPKFYIAANKANMLSVSGAVHAFDYRADGFIPSEGAGVIVLKRLSEALADRDHIYGVIKGLGVNQDGTTNGITAPSAISQERLIHQVYSTFNLNPENIQYIETHGTGTVLGDPIEFAALTRAFGKFTNKTNYCALGSIKTNIGHTSAAAGIASTLKILLSLKNKKIPASLNYEKANPAINFLNGPFYVNTELKDWQVPEGSRRCAAVSSFGFSGTNAHMVIEEAPVLENPSVKMPAYLILLSARTKEQLEQQVQQMLVYATTATCDLGDFAYTLIFGRKHFRHRLACVAHSMEELRGIFRSWLIEGAHLRAVSGEIERNTEKGDTDFIKQGNDCLDLCEKETSENCFNQHLLTIANLFVKGYQLDFNKLYRKGAFSRLSLPVYPFAFEQYWITVGKKRNQSEDKSQENTILKNITHPLLHKEIVSFKDFEIHTQLTGKESFISDHKVNGMSILPGAVYLELLCASLAQKADLNNIDFQLRNINWLRPLVVEREVLVHTRIFTDDRGNLSYEVFTESEGNKLIHCIGNVSKEKSKGVDKYDIAEIINTPWQNVFSASACYSFFENSGLQYGPSHRCIETVYKTSDRVLAKLVLPETESCLYDGYKLNPGLLDAGLQSAIALDNDLLNPLGNPGRLMPFALDGFTMLKPTSTKMWVVIQHSPDNVKGGNVIKLDIDICNEYGEVAVRLNGFSVRRQEQNQSTESGYTVSIANNNSHSNQAISINYNMLTPVWKTISIKEGKIDNITTEDVVIFCKEHTANNMFSKYFAQARTIFLDSNFTIDLIAEKLTAIGNIKNIIWLVPDFELGSVTSNEVIEEQYTGVVLFFRGIKAFLQIGYGSQELTWTVITNNSQPIYPTDQVNPTHVSIHGLVGTMAKEFALWKVRLVDIEEKADLSIQQIFQVPFDSKGDAWIYRSGQWHQRELIPCEIEKQKILNKRRGVYVVLGGAGGIAEAWSEYMIENFDAQIVWIGRREKDAEIQAKLDRLATKGNAPMYLSANATNVEALAGAYEEIKRRFGKINGIVHATIVLKDRGLIRMNEDDFMEGLSAKVDTSVLMARTFKEESLDFVLFFSGIMSFTKTAGQGNYAAGCVFEDAFAHQLRQEWNCPVKVMNWGYWGSTGIVASPEYQSRMQKMGIVSIEPQEGMQALEKLMFGPLDQVAFAKTTRKLVTDNTRLDEYIVSYPEKLPSVFNDGILNNRVQAGEYEDILQKNIGITSQILEVDPNDLNAATNLMDFGLDTSTRERLLKQIAVRFEMEFPISSFLEYESLEKITDWIALNYRIINRATDFKKGSDLKAQKIRAEVLPQILDMEAWLAKFVLVTLKSFGSFEQTIFSIKDCLINTNISSNFERWLEESCRALTEHGYLKYDGIRYRVEDLLSISHNELWKEWSTKKTKWLENSTLKPRVLLLEETLKTLPDILTNKIAITSVLFPNSSMAMVESIYKNNMVAEYFNEVLADAIIGYIDARNKINPNEKIRILEIGAGTGGTSYSIFKKLKEKESYIDEYCYTDLSHAFLQYAEQEYGKYVPYLSYKIFDVEKSVEEQGIPSDYYDIVVAANVLHATRNIHATVRNLKQLLKKNGIIALNEMCNNRLFAHLTFGLLEGWWLYEDEALRIPGCPGLETQEWEKVLEREGFENTYFPVSESKDLDFQIILAESNGVVRKKVQGFSDTRSFDNEIPTIIKSDNLSMPKSVAPEITKSQLIDYLKNQITESVAEVLQSSVDKFRNDENFSSYGIDSIISVNLINHINKRCQLNLQTAVLFDYTSVDTLADFIFDTYKSDLFKDLEQDANDVDFQESERMDSHIPKSTLSNENVAAQLTVNHIRSVVYACIADILAMPEQRIEDEKNFSEYGVDSLIAVSLINAINKETKLNLQTSVLFDYNNVNLLSNYILSTQAAFIEAELQISSNKKSPEILTTSVVMQQQDQDAAYYSRYVIESSGTIDDLKRVLEKVPDIGADEVQVSVKAFSLNFSDLLCVKGLYPNMPPYPFTPGVEASGIVTNIGGKVTSVSIGDSVMVTIGETMGAHATCITCKSKYVLPMPENLSFEQACALPACALTMIDAFEKARIKKGESILIHTATGGTGLIALQLAKKYGAEIYATAGSEAKLDFLRELGVRHCVNYRSTDFEIKINELTQGKGVNVIINTLSGEVIQKNMRCLANGGRYIELAMTALKSAKAIDLSVLNQNQTFFSVNLAQLAIDDPELMDGYKKKMIELMKDETISATIYKQFSFNQLKEAYRCLEDRSNIGKIVVTTSEEHLSIGSGVDNQVKTNGLNEKTSIEPIAVIGISGKFPQSDNLKQFWQHLAEGNDLIVPVSRWKSETYSATKAEGSYCNKGGFLNEIDLFDPLFFNISGVEATHMDPQQRLFLEESWKALEDAGYAGNTTEGTSCGVFVGCHVGDYQSLLKDDSPAQAMWGNAGSVIPARIAYYLNLKGPAVAIDTACSSALVAIHMACQSLWTGEIEMAIAGGVYIQTTPWFYLSANKADMLSPKGYCHSFDDGADGFVPGEGVGAIILKPLSKAKADGDQIYGVIKGSAVNQDGATNGLTAPSAVSQEKLECMVYDKFNINPIDISMVEAHGTGTRLGDPIEFNALTNAFRRYTDKKQYCALGSVKTNMGHAAAAAGVGGLIKVLLSMKNKKIPASLHYEKGNSSIDFENSPFYVNTTLQDWEVPIGKRRCAAISSFGFSGTNAHLVLEEVIENRKPAPIRPGYMIVLSGRTSNELRQRVVDLVTALDVSDIPDLADISYTLLTGRKHLWHRLACVVRSKDELIVFFRKWLEKKKVAQLYTSDLSDTEIREQTLLKKYGNDCIQQCATTDESSFFLEHLATVAELYVQGYSLNYEPLFKGCCKVSLPTYPFARERYWVEEDSKSTSYLQNNEKVSVIHPVVHQDHSSPEGQFFSTTFTGNEFFLKDHQIQKEKILPGVVYLEMARAAFEYTSGEGARGIELTGCTWLKPTKINGNPVSLTTALTLKPDGSVYFTIGDRSGTTEHDGVIHAEGRIQREILLPTVKSDIEDLKKRCVNDFIDSEEFYSIYSAMNIDYGPSHRAIKNIYVGDNIALAQIVLDTYVSNSLHDFVLHPAIMDAALQATLCFDLRSASIPSSLPYAVEEVQIYSPCTEKMWAIIKPTTEQVAESKIKTFNIEVCNETGQVCINIKGFAVRMLDRSAEQLQTIFFEPYWEEEKVISTHAAHAYNSHTLVFCNVAETFVQKLSSHIAQADIHIINPLGDNLDEKIISCSLRLFELVKEILAAGAKNKVLLQFFTSVDKESALYVAMTALLRSAEMENPMLKVQVIQTDNAFPSSQILPISQSEYVNVKYMKNKQLVLKWRELAVKVENNSLPWRDNGVYLISGGIGGIALLFANEIVKQVDKPVLILFGRSVLSSEKQHEIDRLIEQGAVVEYHMVDITEKSGVQQLVNQVASSYGQINGVLHCAGIVKDGLILHKSDLTFREVLEPKVSGLVHLDEATKYQALDLFICFSSVASIIGNIGQADYATANAFMDAYAEYRNAQCKLGEKNGRTMSISWALWKEGGMKLDNNTQKAIQYSTGMAAMSTQEGVQAFYTAWNSNQDHLLVVNGDKEKLRNSILGSLLPRSNKMPSGMHSQCLNNKMLEGKSTEKSIEIFLIGELSSLIKIPPQQIVASAAFENYGMDSLMIVQFTNQLEQFFGPLSKTLLFECQNILELSTFFRENYPEQLEKLFEKNVQQEENKVKSFSDRIPEDKPILVQSRYKGSEEEKELPESASSWREEDIAIIGLSGTYPGAENAMEYWKNLCEAKDSVSEIPANRWDHSIYFDEDKNTPGKTYAKWGGFLDGVDKFDPAFFNISPREAVIMDPQERLFLQCVFSTFEDAGYTRAHVSEAYANEVGVFAGVMYSEYQLYALSEAKQSTLLPGNSSSIANRVSYFFNFNGPSMVVDTMCSSSLSTLHLACQSLRQGESKLAIAGGVNVSVHPNKFLMLAQGNFASTNGRCVSFGSGGDGYVPSEGVGAVLLKKLSQAVADNDHIYGVIKGSAINHGGKTNGFTVPNPKAQANVIKKALDNAGVSARDISYIEAHGTGTSLGDPIEIAGLIKAFKLFTKEEQFCAIGSVKSNIGHCESASGVAGLTKVLLQFKYEKLVPSLHSESLNPNINFSQTPFKVQQHLEEWKSTKRTLNGKTSVETRKAGLSSFGAGGSNAHVIVEEYIPKPKPSMNHDDVPLIILLSAKDHSRLKECAQQLIRYIAEDELKEEQILDIAFTLQTGREEMEERLGFVIFSLSDLQVKLQQFLDKNESSDGLFAGRVTALDTEVVLPQGFTSLEDWTQTLIQEKKFEVLVKLWIQGVKLNWNLLYGANKPMRVSLPTYPFAQKTYWIISNREENDKKSYKSSNGVIQALDSTKGIRLRELSELSEEKSKTLTKRSQSINLTPLTLKQEPEVFASLEVKDEPKEKELKEKSETSKGRIHLAEIRKYLKESLAKALFMNVDELPDTAAFIELGLDSIVGVEWISDINQHFKLSIPATKIYDTPTLAEFAQYIQTELPEKSLTTIQTPKVVPIEDNNKEEEMLLTLKRTLAKSLFMSEDELDIHKNFVELGLDSIVGIEWVNEINAIYGISVTVSKLYDYATLKELANYFYQTATVTEPVKSEMTKISPKIDSLDELLQQVSDGVLDVQSADRILKIMNNS